MDMDIDELVEHPQWQELISTALYHVTKKRRDSGGINDELKSLCIRFITRLAIGLPGPQAADSAAALLIYLLGDLERITDEASLDIPVMEKQAATAQLLKDPLVASQIGCLVSILFFNPTASQSEPPGIGRSFLACTGREVDRMMSMVFLIISTKAYSVEISTGGSLQICVADILSFVNFAEGGFTQNILPSWQKSVSGPSVFGHALSTGFARLLYRRLMHLSTDLVERSSTLPNLTAVRSWVFYANLWATLIEPYIEHTELVDLILSKGFAEFKNDELVLEHVHTFWLKDIPSETFALAPKVVPVESGNKKFNQLEGRTEYLQCLMSRQSGDQDEHPTSNLLCTSLKTISEVLQVLIAFNQFTEDSFETTSSVFSKLFQNKDCLRDSQLEKRLDDIAICFLESFKTALTSDRTTFISHLSYRFLDTVIESHGNLYSNRKSDGRIDLSPGYYLNVFIDIIFSERFLYNPEAIFSSATVQTDFGAIDDSYYLLAKLCEYAIIIIDGVPASDDSLASALLSLTDRCVVMFDKLPRSSFLHLLEASPVARSVAAYLCKHVALSPVPLTFGDISMESLTLIISCAHADNCTSCLHLATRNSLSAMLKFCKYQSEFISSSAITLYTAILARDLDSVEIWNDMDSIDYLMELLYRLLESNGTISFVYVLFLKAWAPLLEASSSWTLEFDHFAGISDVVNFIVQYALGHDSVILQLELEAAFPYMLKIMRLTIHCPDVPPLVKEALKSYSTEDIEMVKRSIESGGIDESTELRICILDILCNSNI